MSTGFCVASTRNGRGTAAAVVHGDRASGHHPSIADCVFGMPG